MAKFHITPVERQALVALHTFVVTLVPQLVAVHGHVDRSLLLSVIPTLAVTALVSAFPGLKKDVEEVAEKALEASDLVTKSPAPLAAKHAAAVVAEVAAAVDKGASST